MRFSNIVSLFFLLASATDASELSREQQQSLARALDNETPSSSILGRCSEAGADDECDDGLECVSVGILLNRCLPISCLEERLNAIDAEEDLDGYAEYIDETAGVTTFALLRQSIKSWWSDEPQENSLHSAMRAAVAENPVPAQKIKAAMQACTPVSRQNDDEEFLVTYDGEKTASGFVLTEASASLELSNGRKISRTCDGIFTIGEITLMVFGFMASPPESFTTRDTIMVGVDGAFLFGGGFTVGASFEEGISLFWEFGFGNGFGGNGGIFFCEETTSPF
jgi:hypothetical protein